jgi:hypothetical protein
VTLPQWAGGRGYCCLNGGWLLQLFKENLQHNSDINTKIDDDILPYSECSAYGTLSPGSPFHETK